MTKRGMIVVTLILAAMLALSAPAAMAQLQPLSAKQATKLAHNLGKKQKRENDVVVFHVEDLKRVNPYTITFAYDERTKFKVFCVAVLRVQKRQSGNTVSVTAKLTKHSCSKIPADALAIERITRKADRAVRKHANATLRGVRRVERSIQRCRKLDVPRNRRAAVSAVYDIAVSGAVARPNLAAIDSFVASLGNVEASSDLVVRAIDGWGDYADVLHSLPAIKDPCTTLRNWEKASWSPQQSPVDMPAYRALSKRSRTDQKAIARGASYLLVNGVYRRVAIAFSTEGLILKYAGD
jgi:hypothetical protein